MSKLKKLIYLEDYVDKTRINAFCGKIKIAEINYSKVYKNYYISSLYDLRVIDRFATIEETKVGLEQLFAELINNFYE